MAPFVIATTRFNHTTWEENLRWRQQNAIDGCIYGVPKRMTDSVVAEADVIVLEMHNDENRIRGIGLIQNKTYHKEPCRIYESDRNYNRYIYRGRIRIDRSQMDADEEKLMIVLDLALFTGRSHSKRGRGIMCLPKRLLETKSMDLPQRFEAILRNHSASTF